MPDDPKPRTGREMLADDVVIAPRGPLEDLAEALGEDDASLIEGLDGKSSLFNVWRRLKQQEAGLEQTATQLQALRRELADEHAKRLGRMLKRLPEVERKGLAKVTYRARVRPGDIRKALRDMGVRAGDLLFVHSKLSGLGYVEAGIPGVIEDLRAAAGKRGTLAMPTFSQNYPGMNEEPYDRTRSPSTAGRITDAFWRMPGVPRSDNPCHSIAAVGPKAEFLTAPHGNWDMFDRAGPFGKLYDENAWIVFLGCSLASNTTLHAVEAWALPYLPPMYLYASDGKGGRREVLCRQFPDWCREWYGKGEDGKIQKRLFARKVIAKRTVGRGAVYAMRARTLVDTCLRILKREPAILLCENTRCRTCPACRAMLDGWIVPDAV